MGFLKRILGTSTEESSPSEPLIISSPVRKLAVPKSPPVVPSGDSEADQLEYEKLKSEFDEILVHMQRTKYLIQKAVSHMLCQHINSTVERVVRDQASVTISLGNKLSGLKSEINAYLINADTHVAKYLDAPDLWWHITRGSQIYEEEEISHSFSDDNITIPSVLEEPLTQILSDFRRILTAYGYSTSHRRLEYQHVFIALNSRTKSFHLALNQYIAQKQKAENLLEQMYKIKNKMTAEREAVEADRLWRNA